MTAALLDGYVTLVDPQGVSRVVAAKDLAPARRPLPPAAKGGTVPYYAVPARAVDATRRAYAGFWLEGLQKELQLPAATAIRWFREETAVRREHRERTGRSVGVAFTAERGEKGRVGGAAPETIWVSADLPLGELLAVVSHEAKHAAQFHGHIRDGDPLILDDARAERDALAYQRQCEQILATPPTVLVKQVAAALRLGVDAAAQWLGLSGGWAEAQRIERAEREQKRW
jgi:hypothetical protein